MTKINKKYQNNITIRERINNVKKASTSQNSISEALIASQESSSVHIIFPEEGLNKKTKPNASSNKKSIVQNASSKESPPISKETPPRPKDLSN